MPLVVAAVRGPIASSVAAFGLLAEAGAAVMTLGLVAMTPGASVAAWLRPGGLDEPLPAVKGRDAQASGIFDGRHVERPG